MDFILLLKLVHVLGAIVWVGGASVLTLLVVLLDRKGDDQATLTGVSHVATLGNRVFAPVGMLTLLTGLTLAWLGGWGFAAWTVLAAAIAASTFLLGALVLGPASERTVKTWKEAGDSAAAIAIGRRVLRLVMLDLGGQFAIISLMVLKPGWTDPHLIVPALVLALGVWGFVRGTAPRHAAQPA